MSRAHSAILALALCGCPDDPAPADLGVVDGGSDGGRAQRWTVIREPAAGEPNLFGLYGDGPDRLFAVGSSGAVLRAQPEDPPALDRDDRPRLTFSRMDSGATADLTAVHGTSASDVYAVGLSGAILHYDGVAWQAETPQKAMPGDPTFSADLWGVFAYSGGAVAVGKSGYWTRRVMGKWTVPQKLQVESLQAVWGTAPNAIWAVGSVGYIFFFDGSAWRSAALGGFTNKLAGVFGTAGNVFAVGLSGSVLRNTGGGFMDYGARADPRCGGGLVPKVFLRGGAVTQGGEVVLIGWEGVIARLADGRCGDGGMGLLAYDESGATTRRLEGIWGQNNGPKTTIYISGVEGLILRGE